MGINSNQKGVIHTLKNDYSRYRTSKPTLLRLAVLFFLNPGFRSNFYYRLQQCAYARGKYRLALMLSSMNHLITGAEFCVGCEIGSNLAIRHPSGIVIGGNVKIGNFLTIQHGVTIGEKYGNQQFHSGSPILGDEITIGANSVIIGNIELGNKITIGALTFVNSTFKSPGKLVGVPARYISNITN